MASKRYNKDGWVDMSRIFDNGIPWNLLIGGRQIGKTYGAITELFKRKPFFLFLRRTQDEVEAIQDPELDPFRAPNTDYAKQNPEWLPWKMFRLNKHVWGIYPAKQDDDGTWKIAGEQVGLAASVNTFAKVRGFSARQITHIIYDEFIPEPHVRRFRKEGSAFFNIYESINSNRELQGEPPVKVICLANANTIANPLMMELGIVEKADRLEQRGLHSFCTKDLYYCNYSDSPKSAQKVDTVLYRLTRGTEFSRMALQSSFSGDERGAIVSKDLREYKPVVIAGEIEIYQHKKRPELYVSMHKSGSCPEYFPGEINFARVRRRYNLIDPYMQGRVLFETYTCELYFREVLGMGT